jgi:hypothetical protein
MTEEAEEKLGLSIGMVSLVLDKAQYLAGRHGGPDWMDEADGSSVEWSYCQYTVKDHDEFLVEDATENERTKERSFTEEELDTMRELADQTIEIIEERAASED